MLASIIGGLFREGLACSWLVLGGVLALTSGVQVKLLFVSQSAAHSVQIGYAAPKAQEKPSVSFI